MLSKFSAKYVAKRTVTQKQCTSANLNEAQKDVFVIGTEIVKINNFAEHIKKSKTNTRGSCNKRG